MPLTIGYDIENLTDAKIKASYKGEVTTDHYGRRAPKHAHGTASLECQTSSTRTIMKAMMDLYDRIINPDLLIRRVTVVADHLVDEKRLWKKRDLSRWICLRILRLILLSSYLTDYSITTLHVFIQIFLIFCIFVFIFSSALGALAGIWTVGRTFSATMVMGQRAEMDAIAAVVLGGTSMSGGKGKISGTIIGVLIIGVLNNGMNLLGIDSSWQYVVQGVVILIAVYMDYIKNGGSIGFLNFLRKKNG